jgi:hypothetical protein
MDVAATQSVAKQLIALTLCSARVVVTVVLQNVKAQDRQTDTPEEQSTMSPISITSTSLPNLKAATPGTISNERVVLFGLKNISCSTPSLKIGHISE